MHVKTAERFSADDPWNGGRPSEFAVEDYRVASATGIPMPAIVSEADGVARFMPDSLCRLYQHGEVPAATLPQLLKHIEDDLIRSDFLPVLGNAVFYASYLAFVVVSCITVAGTALVLVEVNAPLLRGVLVMSGLIGACWLWWHFGYRRRLTRRKQQKKSLLAAVPKLERPARPPAEEQAFPVGGKRAGGPAAEPKLLTLSEVEFAIKQIAVARAYLRWLRRQKLPSP